MKSQENPMFAPDPVEQDTRILHLHDATPDALLGLHLKQMCRARDWSYMTLPMEGSADLDLRPRDVVVMDFFARPLRHAEMREELKRLVRRSGAAFLFVFRRMFSSCTHPIHSINCEYCFLGLDDIEEISFRVRLVQTRTERFEQSVDFAL